MNLFVEKLAGKVVLISGAAGGIGKGIASLLAGHGAKLVLTDRDYVAVSKVADFIRATGKPAIAFEHDVVNELDWARATAKAIAEFGRLDVLVNGAGVASTFPRCFEEISYDEWKRVLSINLDGTFLGTKAGVLAMRDTGGGAIINIGSVAGFMATRGGAAYGASKGAVSTLTKHAAISCAKMGYKIRINAIHPAYVWTPLVQGLAKSLASEDAQDDGKQYLADMHPFGVLGEPADIANAVLFLATDESRLMNGTDMILDGGLLAQ